MTIPYNTDVPDFNFGTRILRAWVPLTGVAAITLVADPGDGYQIVVLGVHAISAVDANLTFTGFDVTERTPGSGSLILPMLGKLMYNWVPADLVGTFRCTASEALQVTPSVDSAGVGFVEIAYFIRKTTNAMV